MNVYFIGGASASGKSTVAKKLASSKYQSLELDDFQNILSNVILDCNERKSATEAVAETAVRQLLASHSSCLVNGSWISAEIAYKLQQEFGNLFQPIFCGFPNAIASERLKAIKETGTHWLTKESDAFGMSWLQGQIDASISYQKECKKYNLEFIDFSDFSTGEAALLSNFHCSALDGSHPALGKH